jgi:hypothetical protein
MVRQKAFALLVMFLVGGTAGAAERKAAAGTGRTVSTSVLARAAVEDIPGHELVQSSGTDQFTTPDPIAGVSFNGAEMKTVTQADVVRGSGLIRGYGVWQAKTGEKIFVAYGYSVPPMPDREGIAAPFEGTFEWLGGTGRLKNIRGKGTLQGKMSRRGEASYNWAGTYEERP